jgi:hypothetical protein
MLWGHTVELWDLWGVRLLFIGAFVGVGGLVLSALSAYVLYRVADVAQQELTKSSKESAERLAELTTEAEVARKETAQAKLELQQIRFPRQLDIDKFKAGIADISPQNFEVRYDSATPDAQSLATQLFVAFLQAGWRKNQKLPAPLTPQPGTPDLRDIFQLLPLTQQSGGQAWGWRWWQKVRLKTTPSLSNIRLLWRS